jgi:DNA polymerase elongation subunit (family B)
MALVYETPDICKNHSEYKGVSIVRRDFCKYTRKVLEEAMSTVLCDRDIEKALRLILKSIEKLSTGQVEMDELIMSKTLNAKYSSQDADNKMPHVSVALKMKKRDPNNFPKSGDRVNFVFICNGEKLLKDRAEDPFFVSENGLNLDFLYYIDNQLIKPAQEIFDVLLYPEVFNFYDFVSDKVNLLRIIRVGCERSAKNAKNNQAEITKFFYTHSKRPLIENDSNLFVNKKKYSKNTVV